MQSGPGHRYTEVFLSQISCTLQVLFLNNNNNNNTNSLFVDSDVF